MSRRARTSTQDESVSTDVTETSVRRSTSSASTSQSKSKAKLDKSGLYDLQQVKRLLDDEIMAFMEDQGYVESTTASNIKIVAGTVAVAAALYSHFGPGEFPANKPVVFACVAIYLVCVGLINISSFVLEASAIFVGSLSKRVKQVSKIALCDKVWIHSTIGGKGSSAYKVEIRQAPRSKHGSVSKSTPYEKYITEDGHFLSSEFRIDMTALLSQLSPGSKKTN
ncbi:unnamed protein product [Agarophyton chilense]